MFGAPRVAALLYSLIESAKLVGVEPRASLREATPGPSATRGWPRSRATSGPRNPEGNRCLTVRQRRRENGQGLADKGHSVKSPGDEGLSLILDPPLAALVVESSCHQSLESSTSSVNLGKGRASACALFGSSPRCCSLADASSLPSNRRRSGAGTARRTARRRSSPGQSQSLFPFPWEGRCFEQPAFPLLSRRTTCRVSARLARIVRGGAHREKNTLCGLDGQSNVFGEGFCGGRDL